MLLAVLFFVLATLFLIPIYETASWKGYRAKVILGATVTYFALSWPAMMTFNALGLPMPWLLHPAWVTSLVLIVLQLLPPRKEAPGRSWLEIKTPCAACGRHLVFPRREAGLVKECRYCGEILVVPYASAAPDGGSSGVEAGPGRHEESQSPIPGSGDDWVPLRVYESVQVADLDQASLEAAQIPAVLQWSGSVFPTNLGCELLVPVALLDRATSVLEELAPPPHSPSR